ncbi:hypothetical protein C8J57DRAFT_1216076 [Mycena rebaudengoi]|nr:hypothetical protein C8J57DRAFT_1216076 [Mycena rebaudengoi]
MATISPSSSSSSSDSNTSQISSSTSQDSSFKESLIDMKTRLRREEKYLTTPAEQTAQDKRASDQIELEDAVLAPLLKRLQDWRDKQSPQERGLTSPSRPYSLCCVRPSLHSVSAPPSSPPLPSLILTKREPATIYTSHFPTCTSLLPPLSLPLQRRYLKSRDHVYAIKSNAKMIAMVVRPAVLPLFWDSAFCVPVDTTMTLVHEVKTTANSKRCAVCSNPGLWLFRQVARGLRSLVQRLRPQVQTLKTAKFKLPHSNVLARRQESQDGRLSSNAATYFVPCKLMTIAIGDLHQTPAQYMSMYAPNTATTCLCRLEEVARLHGATVKTSLRNCSKPQVRARCAWVSGLPRCKFGDFWSGIIQGLWFKPAKPQDFKKFKTTS